MVSGERMTVGRGKDAALGFVAGVGAIAATAAGLEWVNDLPLRENVFLSCGLVAGLGLGTMGVRLIVDGLRDEVPPIDTRNQ